jgi:hypothetical protein
VASRKYSKSPAIASMAINPMTLKMPGTGF